MTVKEAVAAEVTYNANLLIEKKIVEAGLNPDSQYDVALKNQVDYIAAQVLLSLAAMPEYKEGSYSVKINGLECRKRANAILRRLGRLNELSNSATFKVL